jgi:alpha-L-fucosidase
MSAKNLIGRRELLVGTGAALAAGAWPLATGAAAFSRGLLSAQTKPGDAADRARRMQWWHEARFGMFIHWGLYSVIGRHEWVMENEGIPVEEYEKLAKEFKPKPYPARAWAKLAKATGQKYMVMTTKHHEGFCHFETKHTNYCAPKQGPGRDLVKEFVEAARAEGLRVGFYHSLMDWHHPDGARCAKDEEARKRFVEYIHGEIRELMTQYGKIDVLWYDVAWPLDAAGWESERMNKMVFELQPDIIVNNRNLLPGDFSTPEQEIVADKSGHSWESCMTLNDSWGFHRADDAWKNPKQVIRNLIECSSQGGNYLLNIGPHADGSIPEESVKIFEEVGQWMQRNGDTIYASDVCEVNSSNYASFTRKGNTLFMHVYFWPGETVTLGGLLNQVKSVKLHASGSAVKFEQDRFRVRFVGLRAAAPDHPVTTLEIECDGVPKQSTRLIREERPRRGVGV